MNIIRKQNVTVNATNEFQIGDQINIGKYTATCQKVLDKGAIFLLDQYLDKAYQMNADWTNKGGYDASDLRRDLQEDFAKDPEFDAIRDHLIPFENGDLVRIPTVGEFFGQDDWYVMDDAEQWELMKNRKNRVASREGEEYEWGWLQNIVKGSATAFAIVTGTGRAATNLASTSYGVRPVILLVA
jgi:hypothetical protein